MDVVDNAQKDASIDLNESHISIESEESLGTSDSLKRCELIAIQEERLRDMPDKRKSYEFLPQESPQPLNKWRKGKAASLHPSKKREVFSEQLCDDGFGWRKYGQKVILGARYPREYYRCTYRACRGCHALKQTQRVDEDNGYRIIYMGSHTCENTLPSTVIIDEASDDGPFQISFGTDEYMTPELPALEKEILSSKVVQPYAISSLTAMSKANKLVSTGLTFNSNGRTKKNFENAANLSERGPSINVIENIGVPRKDERSVPRQRNGFERGHSSNSAEVLDEPEKEDNAVPRPGDRFVISANCNLQKLLAAFQDVKNKKIAVYGSDGIGKTTMLKAILHQPDLKRSFDFVLWVTIPKHFSRRKIQNALVEQLSIQAVYAKSDDEVAVILRQTLQTRKFVLFLDDVWEYMDLLYIGIPVQRPDNNYKIILTTRSVTICQAMEVDTIIKADILSREDSVQLFHSCVGDVMNTQEIQPYGRAIVEECCGLPLLIKVVGKALRMDKNILSWKRALKGLLLANNLQILSIGYYRLKEYDLKSCFLYSAMFTDGRPVQVTSLVDYFIAEGFLVGSLSDAYRRGHDIVRYLIDVSLLECSDDGSMVKMHGVISELASVILSDTKGLQLLLGRHFRSAGPALTPRNILLDKNDPVSDQPASTEGERFSPSRSHLRILKACEDLGDPPPDEKWEEAGIVFLTDNALSALPESPACPKLLALFLQRNSSLKSIPSSFFESMSSVQILNLSNTRIQTLPESLGKLTSLQVLSLRNCECLHILPPVIGDLKQLLVLDVHGTEICQVPDSMGQLHALMNLHVCLLGAMDQEEGVMLPSQLISKGIISNLLELRELSISVCPGDPRWTKIASDVTTEVSGLKLCSLSFLFPEIENLEYFINESTTWQHRTLTHFNFIVGHDVKRLFPHVSDDLEQEYNQQDRCLRFVDSEDIPDAIGEVLSLATAFYLDHHLNVHSLTQFGCTRINELKFCIVKDCPKLKTIINGKKRKGNSFPFLELLSIHYCWNLSRIWVGPFRAESLSMLRRLSVHSCPRLSFILSLSMVASLSSLEELIIEDCQSLKSVVSNQDHSSTDDDTVDGDLVECDAAKINSELEDKNDQAEAIAPPDVMALRIKVLKLHYLPQLGNIWTGGDLPCLEHVSVYKCPKLRNLNLKSEVVSTIKEIKTEPLWWDALDWDDPTLPAKLKGHVKEIQQDDVWRRM